MVRTLGNLYQTVTLNSIFIMKFSKPESWNVKILEKLVHTKNYAQVHNKEMTMILLPHTIKRSNKKKTYSGHPTTT